MTRHYPSGMSAKLKAHWTHRCPGTGQPPEDEKWCGVCGKKVRSFANGKVRPHMPKPRPQPVTEVAP